MTETEFKPFTPMFEDPPKLPPVPVYEKKARKKRTQPADKPKAKKIPPNIFKKKRKKRGSALTPKAHALVAAADKAHAAKIARRAKQPREAKYTLSEALSIGSALTPEDLKLFGQIEHDLRSIGKAARARAF